MPSCPEGPPWGSWQIAALAGVVAGAAGGLEVRVVDRLGDRVAGRRAEGSRVDGVVPRVHDVRPVLAERPGQVARIFVVAVGADVAAERGRRHLAVAGRRVVGLLVRGLHAARDGRAVRRVDGAVVTGEAVGEAVAPDVPLRLGERRPDRRVDRGGRVAAVADVGAIADCGAEDGHGARVDNVIGRGVVGAVNILEIDLEVPRDVAARREGGPPGVGCLSRDVQPAGGMAEGRPAPRRRQGNADSRDPVTVDTPLRVEVPGTVGEARLRPQVRPVLPFGERLADGGVGGVPRVHVVAGTAGAGQLDVPCRDNVGWRRDGALRRGVGVRDRAEVRAVTVHVRAGRVRADAELDRQPAAARRHRVVGGVPVPAPRGVPDRAQVDVAVGVTGERRRRVAVDAGVVAALRVVRRRDACDVNLVGVGEVPGRPGAAPRRVGAADRSGTPVVVAAFAVEAGGAAAVPPDGAVLRRDPLVVAVDVGAAQRVRVVRPVRAGVVAVRRQPRP